MSTHSCESVYGGGSAAPPFAYYQEVNGQPVEVGPVAAPGSELCVFPNATCNAGNAHGRAFQCCNLTDAMAAQHHAGSNANQYALMGLLFFPLLLYNLFKRKCSKVHQQSEAQQGQVLAERARQVAARQPLVSRETTPRAESKVGQFLKSLVFMCALTLEVVLLISLQMISQKLLSVQSRNAQLAADAYLTPVREVFQFLEDVATVNINMAMGMGSLALLRSSLAMGITGGAALGTLAALVTTGLVCWPTAAHTLFAPFSSGAASAGGCSQLLSASEIVDLVRPYVVLSAWQWPFSFVNMSLRGFLLGAREWTLFAVISVLELGTQAVALLVFFQQDPKLATLGWAKLIGSSGTCAIMLGHILRSQDIRQRYLPSGLFGRAGDQVEAGVQHGLSWKLVRHGLSAMLSDLSVQTGITLGIYITGIRYGIGAMYQVSAFQAAFPRYGIGYVQVLALSFRMNGTQLLGMKLYDHFERMYYVSLAYTSALAVGSIVSLWPYRDAIAFGLGEQACQFATEASCLVVFEGVFGGPGQDGLGGVPFSVFLVFMGAQCFYKTFKAGVYACLDWDFMAKVSAATIMFASAPALCIGALAVDSSTAILVAMYMPCLVLGVAYAWRTAHNIRLMKTGISGPWDQFNPEQDSDNA